MNLLNRELLSKIKPNAGGLLPERVIQFGEGNFLRAFVDWMIHSANQQGVFNGSVVLVQPIAQGLAPQINEQDGLYTLILRGIDKGEKVVKEEIITSVSRALSSYCEWEEVLHCAENSAIDILISNTTEAGIAYRAEERLDENPPVSFPGKVCAYLYRRYQTFKGDRAKGMVLIPCELIDRNGDRLKDIVLKLAVQWGLEADFTRWIEEANYFVNTLVDRIVTGYPTKEEVAALTAKFGYTDRLLVTGEIFHLWVIEGPEAAQARFPLHRAGLQVKWVSDLTPYRTRKVRILNGAHTSTVPVAHLAGIESVREAVEDELLGQYIRQIAFEEIIPTINMPIAELEEFASQVMERFQNPFIHHRWLDISLNSISKFKTRVLPSLQAYLGKRQIPQLMTFSLAALINFYHGLALNEKGMEAKCDGVTYLVRDDREVLQFFFDLWQTHGNDIPTLVDKVLSERKFWDDDLSAYPGFAEQLSAYVSDIQDQGMRATLAELIK